MAESNRHYLINMVDGRVILFTKQAARQLNYHPISAEVALALADRRLDWKDVVSRIKANLINNQDAWDDLLKKKTTMNTRKTTLAIDDSEGSETVPEKEDVSEEFDMPVDAEIANGGETPKAAAKKATTTRKGGKAKDPAPEATEAADNKPDGESAGDPFADL